MKETVSLYIHPELLGSPVASSAAKNRAMSVRAVSSTKREAASPPKLRPTNISFRATP